MPVRAAHEKGSRIHYSFARDVLTYFREHELGYIEKRQEMIGTRMNILGLNAFHGDASAAVLRAW